MSAAVFRGGCDVPTNRKRCQVHAASLLMGHSKTSKTLCSASAVRVQEKAFSGAHKARKRLRKNVMNAPRKPLLLFKEHV